MFSALVFTRVTEYSAEKSGFGGIDPALYEPGAPEIVITYPTQDRTKISAGYLGEGLDMALFDRVEVQAYGQDNERELDFSFVLPLGGPGVLTQINENFTDIRTYGFRAEARKLASPALLLTYGVDVLRERAEGEDLNTTTGVLVGEGGYDGLVAVFDNLEQGQTWTLHGYILEGELPPDPEPFVAE